MEFEYLEGRISFMPNDFNPACHVTQVACPGVEADDVIDMTVTGENAFEAMAAMVRNLASMGVTECVVFTNTRTGEVEEFYG